MAAWLQGGDEDEDDEEEAGGQPPPTATAAAGLPAGGYAARRAKRARAEELGDRRLGKGASGDALEDDFASGSDEEDDDSGGCSFRCLLSLVLFAFPLCLCACRVYGKHFLQHPVPPIPAALRCTCF